MLGHTLLPTHVDSSLNIEGSVIAYLASPPAAVPAIGDIVVIAVIVADLSGAGGLGTDVIATIGDITGPVANISTDGIVAIAIGADISAASLSIIDCTVAPIL